MYKFKLIILILISYSNLVIANSETLNRLTVFDLGYSTASKGYLALGYGREVSEKNLLSVYLKSWSDPDSDTGLGLNLKYSLSKSVQNSSWLLGLNLQSGGYKDGDYRDMTTFSPTIGYQWRYSVPLSLTLESGFNITDQDTSSIKLFGLSFSYLF